MRKIGKKILSLALTVVMCLALAPVSASAAESGACGGHVTWTLENNVLTISGEGAMTDYRVSEDAPWNGHHETITSIVIEEGVTGIGNHAFTYCTAVTSVAIPNGVTRIGDWGLAGCHKLTSVAIPESVTSIGWHAFYDCDGLTSLTIPSGVTSIETGAFQHCAGLTSVTIPEGVTSIGQEAFSMCTGLPSVTIPNSVTSLGKEAFSGCSALTSVTVPGSVDSVGESAFFSCTGLTSATIASGVTRIETHAFGLCPSLASVTIPASVTSIRESAFGYCPALTDVYFGGTRTQWDTIVIDYSYGGNDALKSAAIHCGSAVPDTTQPPIDATSTQSAAPTNDLLNVDGVSMTPAAYKIGNANFFKLRDVAMMLNGTAGQFSVDYDGELRAVKIVTGQPYIPQGQELKSTPTANATAEVSNNAIYINGEKVELTVYKINGENYFGIRDLGSRLGFNVGWEPGRGMFIESGKPYDPNN